MPGRKQEMKLIDDLKKLKATYKNRRDGLVQKAEQLATLCDIDVFLVCFGPAAAGSEVTTWPADGRAVADLVERFRAIPPEKVKQVLNTPALLREELGKQQRKLLRVRQCGADEALASWDCSLDDLSVDGLNALHSELVEAQQRALQRMAALGGMHVHDGGDGAVPSAAAQQAPAFQSSVVFDFPFDSSDAGGYVASPYNYNPHGFPPPPAPVFQPPPLAFQMPPPSLSCFQMPLPLPPPPPPLAAPPDLGMAGAGFFMDSLPYTTNVVDGGAAAAGFYDDIAIGQGFAADGGYDDGFLGHGSFASVTGYDLKPDMDAGIWRARTLNDPVDIAAALQMQHNLAELPGSSSNNGSFQGGF